MIAAICTLLVLCGTVVESIQRTIATTRHDNEGRDVTIPPQKSHSDKNTIWSQGDPGNFASSKKKMVCSNRSNKNSKFFPMYFEIFFQDLRRTWPSTSKNLAKNFEDSFEAFAKFFEAFLRMFF
jgi:hypothetical protein